MRRIVYNPFHVLLHRIGATFAWHLTGHGLYLEHCLLYWPPFSKGKLRPTASQVFARLLIRLSGFMSQHRGLRWDNRSRRGLK